MMVPLFPFRPLTVLNRFYRAPLDASVTLFATVVPDRSTLLKMNISYRADLYADAAGSTGILYQKTFIHRCHMGSGEPVQTG